MGFKFTVPNQPAKQEVKNVPAVQQSATPSTSVGFSLQKRISTPAGSQQSAPISTATVLQEIAGKTTPQATPAAEAQTAVQAIVLASGPAYTTQPDLLGPGTKEQFQANLALLQQSIEQPQLIAHTIRRIMGDLQTNPELREFLLPEHGGAMVRFLRTSYGVAVEAKAAKSKKKKDTGPGMDIGDLSNMLVDLS